LALLGPVNKLLQGSAGQQSCIEAIKKKLAEHKLDVHFESEGGSSSSPRLILLVSMAYDQLCYEAEHEALMKRLSSPDSRPDSLQFMDNGVPVALAEFTCDTKNQFKDSDAIQFFEPWQQLILTWHRLQRVEATGCSAVREPHAGEGLIHALQREETIETVIALRTTGAKWLNPDSPFSVAGLDALHQGFGDEVAMYFVFMRTFTFWLVPPGLLAIVLNVLWYFLAPGVSVDESMLIPCFSVAMVLWCAVLPSFIERSEADFACRWGRLHATRRERHRAGYYGALEVSPVTGAKQLFYPSWKRGLKYVASAIVTLAMLAVAFFAMICSLNLQGYIHESGWSEAAGLELTLGGNPFLIKPLAQLARPGRILDPTGAGDPYFGGWITLAPTILHVLAITFLNNTYRGIACALTEWENHRLQQEYESSLIVKRFLFEAFDAYIALFYVAFFMRDPVALRAELVSLYTVDTIRRVLLETVLPFALQNRAKAQRAIVDAVAKKTDAAAQREDLVEEQLNRGEYEIFDDYLEMVIQFGYVSLFASAFPLAAFLSVLANAVELHSDRFKLLHAYQRPIASAASGMPHTWRGAIRVISWMAVVTNILIFGFVSEQAMQFAPSLFKMEKEFSEQHKVKAGGVWMLLGMENVLLAIAAALSVLAATKPAWVKIALKAREYRRGEVIREELKKKHATTFSPWLCTS